MGQGGAESMQVCSCFPEPLMYPCRESIVSLKRKYLKTEAEEGPCLSQPSMDGILDAIAKEGCSSLLEEVFLDLEVRWAPPSLGLEHGVVSCSSGYTVTCLM